jgi:ABC-type lipoprotein export system ATPase subunit
MRRNRIGIVFRIFNRLDGTSTLDQVATASAGTRTKRPAEGARDLLDLRRLLHADGQTIVLVTHDPVVADDAGRVVEMRDGGIDEAGMAVVR